MTMINEPETVVRRGAELLDEKVPLWWDRIKRKLSIASPENCVLAQVYGNYTTGWRILGLSVNNNTEYGFSCAGTWNTCICLQLTELWEAAIKERRESSTDR